MRLAEAQKKIAVGGGGVHLVTQLLQRRLGGLQPGGRGKRDQRGPIIGGNKIKGTVHFNFRMVGGASLDPVFPCFMRSEPAVTPISPRDFFELSIPRDTTLRFVQYSIAVSSEIIPSS